MYTAPLFQLSIFSFKIYAHIVPRDETATLIRICCWLLLENIHIMKGTERSWFISFRFSGAMMTNITEINIPSKESIQKIYFVHEKTFSSVSWRKGSWLLNNFAFFSVWNYLSCWFFVYIHVSRNGSQRICGFERLTFSTMALFSPSK